jgi:hypothetical protein
VDNLASSTLVGTTLEFYFVVDRFYHEEVQRGEETKRRPDKNTMHGSGSKEHNTPPPPLPTSSFPLSGIECGSESSSGHSNHLIGSEATLLSNQRILSFRSSLRE